MAIKVEVSEKKSDAIQYPCLMKSKVDDEIVLFIEPKDGIIIIAGGGFTGIGGRLTTSDMAYFTPYEGTITLSNE